jgi:NTE family protein
MNITNLVFEGGGVRGVAFAGAIKYLDDIGELKNIKRVAGSSAGAFAALLIAIGFNSQNFYSLLNETNLSQFNDSNKGCCSYLPNMSRVLFYYSWHRGDKLEKFIGDILEKYTGNRNSTFKEIYDKFGKELIVTATNINKARTIYFNYKDYPDFLVRKAVRASMAIPLYFKPIIFDGDYLADGGLLNNYPIWIFDNADGKTIGLKLMSNDEQEDELIFHGNLNTNTLPNYILSIIDCMGWAIERALVSEGYWEKTVVIPTFEIKTTDFDIDAASKTKLFNSGYNAMKNYLNE